jgi:DDE_Tnp_1-associated
VSTASVALPAAADIRCLAQVFAAIPDPRRTKGLRHRLGSLLSLIVVALLCGEKSMEGFSRFGREHPELLPALGFAPPHQGRVAARRSLIAPPSNDTLARATALVCGADMNAAVGRWLGRLLAVGEVASIDGKALRCSGSRMLSVWCPALGHVLWQEGMGSTKDAELPTLLGALPDLLARLAKVRLFTADAGFCHKAVARHLVAERRHYLLQLKAPHATDLAIARDSFAQITRRAPLATTVEKRGARGAARS